jgi:hypothetical protein
MIQWDEVWKSALSALVAVIVLYVLTFIYYFLKRKSLPDPSRQLTIKQQQKVTKYLRPYSPNRIARLHYYPGVRDASGLGQDIQIVLQGLGWGCDIEGALGLSERPSHSKGLWVYGEANGDPAPPTSDLLQDAFRHVGLRIHVDSDTYGETGTCLVIGFWE